MNFNDLKIYNLSFSLAEEIYKLSLKFPDHEIFGLTSQIRRASVSVFSNISEGFGRRTNQDFKKFLYNSRGSLNEIKSQINFAHKLNYISLLDLNSIIINIDDLGRKLTYFMKQMKI